MLILPKTVNEWVTADVEKLCMKHHVLWYNPANTNLNPGTDQKTIRLKIPLTNKVDLDSLLMMLKKSADDELIENEVI